MRRYLGFAFIVLVLGACAKSIIEDSNESDFVIKAGTVCGWCAQNDTLTIDGSKIRYVNFIQCNTTNPSVKKTGEIDQESLNQLKASLDFAEFKKLDMNSCNVCVDGCDDWITIKNGVESHTIRFSRDDPKLQPIKAFVESLSSLKEKYRTAN